MAVTPSTMLPLGTSMPQFSLPSCDGKVISSSDLSGCSGVVVMFICNHCPFVINMKAALVKFANDMKSNGISVIAINSNDVENYDADSVENMLKDSQEYQYPFPYLFDESQTVAKQFQAACTPDFYLFDGAAKLHYRGQFDKSRPNNGVEPNGEDLRVAVSNMLEGKPPVAEQVPSVGCNIKWKEGEAPAYFG